jgi:integrase
LTVGAGEQSAGCGVPRQPAESGYRPAFRAADDVAIHDLRDSSATRLGSDGVPVNAIQPVMGHQKASTTVNRYTHAPTDYDERVRTAMDAAAGFR